MWRIVRVQPGAREGQTGPQGVADGSVVLRGRESRPQGEGALVQDYRKKRRRTKETGMGLTAPEKVQKLQEALHAKAKGSPEFRFYSLYDKVYRPDVLAVAYQRCKDNKGAAGVDGETFEDIEAYGVERWLGGLAQELKERRYRPQAVRRVNLPKPGGGKRPLGIPTIKDRVCQTAAVLVLEPIFEADMPEEQYGYRPGRGAHDAVRHAHKLVNTGHTEVVDADLSGYFDSIPHAELMKSVARRVSDGAMLHLIKMWLVMPVEEEDDRGNIQRTTRSKDTGRGTPQGAPISPLLANLYMRRFVLGWKVLGWERKLRARIVNYADDFVLCCKGRADEALEVTRRLMAKLKLTINERKTRICRLPEESFNFLGYTIGRCHSPKTGRAYLGTSPSHKAIQRVCKTISEFTCRRHLPMDVEKCVTRLNHTLTGWSNYFCLGPVSKAFRAVDAHARKRLRRWLRKKHAVKGRGTSRYPDEFLYGTLGLVRLEVRTCNFPWAKGVTS